MEILINEMGFAFEITWNVLLLIFSIVVFGMVGNLYLYRYLKKKFTEINLSISDEISRKKSSILEFALSEISYIIF